MSETVSAEQAKQTKWWKRSKAEREAVYVERTAKADARVARADARVARADARVAEVKARSDAMPSWGEVLGSGGVKFEGVRLTATHVEHKGTRVPLPAAARVESAGDLHRRITATRLVTTGVGGLIWKKKRDDRELYLTVSGDGAEFVVEVDPKKGAAARQFAAKVNSAKAPG